MMVVAFFIRLLSMDGDREKVKSGQYYGSSTVKWCHGEIESE